MFKHLTASSPAPARVALRFSLLALTVLTAGCLEDFGQNAYSLKASGRHIDTSPPASATDAGWVQNSPTPTASITASWVASASPDVTAQWVQPYSDANCGTPRGAAVAVGGPGITSHNFNGDNHTSYTYQVISVDSAGNETTSACSAPLSVELTDAPSATLSVPSASSVNASGSTTYTVTYSRAASVSLTDATPLSLVTTGTATCQLTVSGSGAIDRTVTLHQCTGDGTVALRLAPDTSRNLAGSDSGAGPATPVQVDNTAPGVASNLAWLQASPSAATSVTASWAAAIDPDLAGHAIQLHGGAGCGAPLGPPQDPGSTAIATRNFTGNDVTTYSFAVTSTDAAGNTSTSACSPAMIIHTAGIPQLTLSTPSAGRINASGTAGFALVWSDAEVIGLSADAVSLVTTGSASCQFGVHGNGSTTRFVDVTDCSGDGTVAITVAGGAATNLSGADQGAGPSTPVLVDNTGPVDPQGLGWTSSSPATTTPVTAAWSPSRDADLSSQSLQPYADDSCANTAGDATALPGADTRTADLPAQDGSSYTYRIISTDDLGNTAVSPCSIPLSVSLVSTPGISLSSTSVAAGGSASYWISGGTGELSVWISGSGSLSNSNSDGTYYAPTQCEGGQDTVYVTDALGYSASVTVDYGGDSYACNPVQVTAWDGYLSAGSSTGYQISGGTGPYNVSVDAGWVDNSTGDGNFTAPYGCSAGTATITVTDANGYTANSQVSYSGDDSQCDSAVYIYVESSYVTGGSSTNYTVYGGSGSYKVAVTNLWAVGDHSSSINNDAGSGTYTIDPGACGKGYSGTDEITVWDGNGSSASVQISWATGECSDEMPSISLETGEIWAGSSKVAYWVSGQDPLVLEVSSLSGGKVLATLDNASGSGVLTVESVCGLKDDSQQITVYDGNGQSASAQFLVHFPACP